MRKHQQAKNEDINSEISTLRTITINNFCDWDCQSYKDVSGGSWLRNSAVYRVYCEITTFIVSILIKCTEEKYIVIHPTTITIHSIPTHLYLYLYKEPANLEKSMSLTKKKKKKKRVSITRNEIVADGRLKGKAKAIGTRSHPKEEESKKVK